MAEESQKSYYVKSGLFSFFEKGSMFVFGFLGFALLARILTKQEMGIWVLFMTTAAMVEVSIVGLLQNAMVKYLSIANKKDYGRIILATLTLYVIVATLLAAILFFSAPLLAEYLTTEGDAAFQTQLAYLFKLFCLLLFILIPFYLFNFIQQANLSFEGIFWSNFSRKGIFFSYVLISYFGTWQLKLENLLLVQIIGATLGSFIAWNFGKKYLKIQEYKIDWAWVKELFRFGKFTFGTNLSTMLYKGIDKLMLGSFAGTVPTALYDAAIKVTNLVDVPAMTVASVVFPQSSIQSDKNDPARIKALYEQSVGAILAIILPFILVVFMIPEFTIWVVAGNDYLDAAPVLRLTVLYGLFLPFAIQFGTILDSIGRPKINFVFTLIGVITNVTLNYIFIKVLNMGIYGAAYGTLLTYGISFALYQIVLRRMFKVNALMAFTHIPGFYRQGWDILNGFLKKKK